MDKNAGEVQLPYLSWAKLDQRAQAQQVEFEDYFLSACMSALSVGDAFLLNSAKGQETYLVVAIPGSEAVNVPVNPQIPLVSTVAESSSIATPNPFADQIYSFPFPTELYEPFSALASEIGVDVAEFLSWTLGIKDLIDRQVDQGRAVFVTDGIDGDLMLAKPAEG